MACDRWDCADCRHTLAFRWGQRVRYGIALQPTRSAWFWTLTLPPWVETANQGYKILPARWDNLRKSLQRSVGTWDYCAFIEAHPHRHLIPHFHLVSIQKCPSRLKDLAVHCGFGYQAKEIPINGAAASYYVAKYANKTDMAIPRHFRRVRVSRRWPSLPSPVYEVPVYPVKKREALSAYFLRMSALLGHPVDILRDRWLAVLGAGSTNP